MAQSKPFSSKKQYRNDVIESFRKSIIDARVAKENPSRKRSSLERLAESIEQIYGSSQDSAPDFFRILQNIIYQHHGTGVDKAMAIAKAFNRSLGSMLPSIYSLDDSAQTLLQKKESESEAESLRQYIAQSIILATEKRNMSLAKLGKLTCLSPVTINDAVSVRSKKTLNISTLWIIANALQLPVDYFVPTQDSLIPIVPFPSSD